MSAKPLTREEILGADDIEIKKVSTPKWSGGYVYVKGMTGIERDKFESSIVDTRGKNTKTNMINIRAKLAAETICDENGVKLFSVKDVNALGKKSAAMLQIVFDEAMDLSGISDANVEELAEEMEENPSDGSVSD